MDNSTFSASLSERLGASASQWLVALAAFGRGLRVSLPGQIVDFDATKQTATVQPLITENVEVAGVIQQRTLAPLKDVPVVFPRAGGFTLTMPVAAGDECLVLFADSCIDAWWQSGGQSNQAEQRRHSLADGFAILGPWNQQRTLTSYSSNSAQLRSDDGTVTVDVAGTQVTVTAPTIKLQASSEIDLNAPTININGSSAVNIATNTKIDSKTFLTHEHTGVQTGGGTSGPVA